MYTNKIGCTVFARTVGKDRMEQYVRHFFPAVYWEDMKGQSQSNLKLFICKLPHLRHNTAGGYREISLAYI